MASVAMTRNMTQPGLNRGSATRDERLDRGWQQAFACDLAAIDGEADTLDVDTQWRQVLSRDPAASFVYAVTSTGIFCRPSCSSRRPLRANVRFFHTTASAAAAGFRACLRCRPITQPDDAATLERLTSYLQQNLERSVSLAELARISGYAPGTVQRLFKRVLGLSPRAWANARRADAYRALLAGASSEAKTHPVRITDAVYNAGFSSPSRAHAAAPLGMEARRYRAQGAGERIGYTISEASLSTDNIASKLGLLLVAATARGVCAVLLGNDERSLRAELGRRFPRAALVEDAALKPQLTAVLAGLTEHRSAHSLPLDLRGTAFQARVWAALQTIPLGETRSYTQLAHAIGAPSAARAVAAACGQNPVAIVVPCHRVIGSDGKLTGYRWGMDRKRALLDHERESPRDA